MGEDGPVTLFRAVLPPERDSIERLGRFTNPLHVTVKYFALTLEGARRYAAMAETSFGDGPFVVFASGIARSRLTWAEKALVDSGIDSVALPTRSLQFLLPPVIVEAR